MAKSVDVLTSPPRHPPHPEYGPLRIRICPPSRSRHGTVSPFRLTSLSTTEHNMRRYPTGGGRGGRCTISTTGWITSSVRRRAFPRCGASPSTWPTGKWTRPTGDVWSGCPPARWCSSAPRLRDGHRHPQREHRLSEMPTSWSSAAPAARACGPPPDGLTPISPSDRESPLRGGGKAPCRHKNLPSLIPV